MSDVFLADDLSGALDAAAAFHHAGEAVRIAWTMHGWEQAGAGGGVLGFTTETRNASPDAAAATVTAALAHARTLGARLVYKKIDSTLRGPVAAEVATLAAEMPEVRILFAPANPGVGRTVRDGVLLVHGVPVAETEFGRDPASPVRESDLRRLLGGALGARVEIPDTATASDLAAAVARMDAAGAPWVGVGSGALARPIAARARRTPGTVARPVSARLPMGPCLMLGGSAHRANRVQATRLAEERGVPIVELRVNDTSAAITAARREMGRGGGVSLLIEEQRGDRGVILGCIARAAAEILRTTGARRVFATGGETAFALAGELGISALTFGTEIESGLSVSRGESQDGARLLAVKPGGFGDERTWVRAWDALVAG